MDYYHGLIVWFLSYKVLSDSLIEILFVYLFIYIIKKRSNRTKLTLVNYLVLFWVSALFMICCFQSVFSLYTTIKDREWGKIKPENYRYIQLRDTINFMVFPFKDFLIGISFTAVYYYEGRSSQRSKLGISSNSPAGV